MSKVTYIDEVEIKDKVILLRLDLNVSLNPNHTIADDVRIKALIAALEGVDIAKVLSQASAMPVAVAAAPAAAAAPTSKAEAKEEKEEKKEEAEESGIEGLGALFG